jgi:hypothetical protein
LSSSVESTSDDGIASVLFPPVKLALAAGAVPFIMAVSLNAAVLLKDGRVPLLLLFKRALLPPAAFAGSRLTTNVRIAAAARNIVQRFVPQQSMKLSSLVRELCKLPRCQSSLFLGRRLAAAHLITLCFEDFSSAQPFLLQQVNNQLVYNFLSAKQPG